MLSRAPYDVVIADLLYTQLLYPALLDAGLYTFVRWNTIMTNPPLCITEAELDEGFEILDGALEIGDRALAG